MTSIKIRVPIGKDKNGETIWEDMTVELSYGQETMAIELAKHAHIACALAGIPIEKAEPKHFNLTAYRYYGKINNTKSHLDRCIEWCVRRNKQKFTAARFGKWCENQLKFNKEAELRQMEMKQLKFGNQHQRAEYARRVSNNPQPHGTAEETF